MPVLTAYAPALSLKLVARGLTLHCKLASAFLVVRPSLTCLYRTPHSMQHKCWFVSSPRAMPLTGIFGCVHRVQTLVQNESLCLPAVLRGIVEAVNDAESLGAKEARVLQVSTKPSS